MTANEYVPDEMDARGCFLDGAAGAFVTEDWEAFLARVRREAKAEAWTETCEAFAWCIANGPIEDALPYVAEHNPYRDAHYPEETP